MKKFIVILLVFLFSANSLILAQDKYQGLSAKQIIELEKKEDAKRKAAEAAKKEAEKNPSEIKIEKTVTTTTITQTPKSADVVKPKSQEKTSTSPLSAAPTSVTNVSTPAVPVTVGKTPATVPAVPPITKRFSLLEKVEKADEFCLGLGFRGRTLNGFYTLGFPKGFTASSDSEQLVYLDLLVQLSYGPFVLECQPIPYTTTAGYQFYGSSVGLTKQTRDMMLMGKVCLFKFAPSYSLFFGLGAEHTKIDSAISLGGFVFPTDGEGWSVVFQISGQYKLTNEIILGVDYERHNVRAVTSIPGVEPLTAITTDSVSFRVIYEFSMF
jgi:hypothetical protein